MKRTLKLPSFLSTPIWRALYVLDTEMIWVKMINSDPVSSIVTNTDKSQRFDLRRVIRQDDPLSPLPSSCDKESGVTQCVSAVKSGNVESVVNIYADDLLICLSDPVLSVPNFLNHIKSFSKLSGCKKKKCNKREFMPLINNLSSVILKSLPFKLHPLYLHWTQHSLNHQTFTGIKFLRYGRRI